MPVKHPNYWDHTEKERSELTYEEVESLLAYELMTKGVLKVAHPVYMEEESVSIDKETVYAISLGYRTSLAFRDPEKAKAFIELEPYEVETPYNLQVNGEDVSYLKKKAVLTVESRTLFKSEDVDRIRSILEKNKQIRTTNERMKKEYEESARESTEACKDVWEDWGECTSKASRYKRIMDTLEEYRKMSLGKEDIARQFLGKAFPSEEIEDADKWFASA